MNYKSITLFLLLPLLSTGQAELRLGCGAGTSFSDFENKFECQLKANFLYKSLATELNYSAQPYSYFGVKSKTMFMIGFHKDINKIFDINTFIGIGSFKGTKYTDIQNSSAGRAYYPKKYQLVAKLETNYKLKKIKNTLVYFGIYYTHDNYMYGLRGGTVVINRSLTCLLGINYCIKNNLKQPLTSKQK